MTTGAVISDLDWLTARAQCEQLFLDFHRVIDAGRATQATNLFAADGVFELRDQRYEGASALADFLARREADTSRRTRHLASNFQFDLETDTRACGTANLTLFTLDENGALALEAVIDCRLAFTRGPDGRWLTRSRHHVRFASAGPG